MALNELKSHIGKEQVKGTVGQPWTPPRSASKGKSQIAEDSVFVKLADRNCDDLWDTHVP